MEYIKIKKTNYIQDEVLKIKKYLPKPYGVDVNNVCQRLQYAIKIGKIIKPTICSCVWCEGNSKKIEAHHFDYSKPFQVTWLCKDCHRQIHKYNATAIKVFPKNM